jgi:hypothetical protein
MTFLLKADFFVITAGCRRTPIGLYFDKRRLRGKDDKKDLGTIKERLLPGRIEAGKLLSGAGFGVVGTDRFF